MRIGEKDNEFDVHKVLTLFLAICVKGSGKTVFYQIIEQKFECLLTIK